MKEQTYGEIDIHMEGPSTRRGIHMKEETRGGTYTRRGHIHAGDIHLKEQTYRGDIHGGDIHGGGVQGGDIRIHTVGPRRRHTRRG